MVPAGVRFVGGSVMKNVATPFCSVRPVRPRGPIAAPSVCPDLTPCGHAYFIDERAASLVSMASLTEGVCTYARRAALYWIRRQT